MRLHIGGKERRDGWKILNIVPGEKVDFVGDCRDLTQFGDASVEEIYASHVLEHLDYQDELLQALRECFRVLKQNGIFHISVPDLQTLCRMYLNPQISQKDRFAIMRVIFGGHTDQYDYHNVGFDFALLRDYLSQAGFQRIERVESHGIFNDASELGALGVRISLNLRAYK